MENLKKDFKKALPFIIGIAILIMILIEGRATATKKDTGKQQVCVHFYFEVIVEGSPGLVFTTYQPGDLLGDQEPCSTTQHGSGTESGCKYHRGLLAHDGDNITVEVHRAFALASKDERRMTAITYPIVAGMGTDPKNESFTDPHGHGRGRVHVAVGDPSTCKPSRRR